MTKLVGIVNLTPDSFSGDGAASEQALQQIDAMMADGASVIDIGAESTRPGATVLSPEEEWARIEPVAAALKSRPGKAAFSIDTRNPKVAEKALAAGFSWINDVSGGSDAMFALAKASGCSLVLMHAMSVPADPRQMIPEDADPVAEVLRWGEAAIARAERAGVQRAQIIIDPGIGFGKRAGQSLALIRDAATLHALGCPVLVGHSRKSFLSQFTDKPAARRDPETLAVSYYLAGEGIDYLRVHDMKSHAAMLKIREAL